MSKDYFSLLGLGEMSFNVDLKVMESNYINIQRTSHPDRFFSIEGKESAVKHIEQVNKAYLILKSPVARAEYILSAHGTKLSDEDRSRIVGEVFDLELSGQGAEEEILKCQKKMEEFFASGDMYQAAQQVEKLKYLKRLCRNEA